MMAGTDKSKTDKSEFPKGRLESEEFLNAKLHQGYDPNTEFKERSNILSAALSADEDPVIKEKSVQANESGFFAAFFDSVSSKATESHRPDQWQEAQNETLRHQVPTNLGSANSFPGLAGFSQTEPNALMERHGGLGSGSAFAVSENSASAGTVSNMGVASGGASSLRNNAFALMPSAITGGGRAANASSSQPTIDIHPSNPGGPPNPGGSSNPGGSTNPNDPNNPQNPVLSAPILSVSVGVAVESQPVSVAVGLTATTGAITVVVIGNLPAGVTLSAGVQNSDGTWTLTPSQLPGLTLITPPHFSGHIDLDIHATSTLNGSSLSYDTSVDIDVLGMPTAPTLSVIGAVGLEDTTLALTINAGLVDTDGSETLAIVIKNMPAGAVLSAGIDHGAGIWILTPQDLNGLTLTPPSHFSGHIDLEVTAVAMENGAGAGVSLTLPVVIDGAATTPLLSVHGAIGIENMPVPLVIDALLVDSDSETLTITITGVPAGANLSAGINNGNGTWTLTSAQLAGLQFIPAANDGGDVHLTVTAISSENGTIASVSVTLDIDMTGIASSPLLTVHAASGDENSPIALDINAALADTDGSETLSITIGNVPNGVILSAGVNNGNGSWTLTPMQLTGLTITPAPFYHGILNLSVTAQSSENGTTASVSTVLPVNVGNVLDLPVLNVQGAAGLEDHSIALSISASVADPDSVLGIVISNVPNGAVLSAGIDNGNGTWTLIPAQLAGLTIIPPEHFSGDLNLIVTANANDNGQISSNSAVLTVAVAGVATTPTLSVVPAIGVEDATIALNINAALSDIDGSETLSIIIGNMPVGATLSAGIDNGNGSWTLSASQLANLSLNPLSNYSGTFNLDVTATSSENGTIAHAHIDLPITILGIADAPTLNLRNVRGHEDTAIALNIAAALVDTDGSETLGIKISGVPTGATLSAGINLGNGVWSVMPAQLSGLKLIPPLHYSGAFALSIAALATENNGAQAQTTVSQTVTIAGVASAPLLSVTAASGLEDTAIPLVINPALTDNDGSERLSVVISNVPNGAVLSAGLYAGNGKWTLSASELTGLTITPPNNYSGAMSLQVTAVATENNGNHTGVTVNLPVTVTPVVDTPTLSVSPAVGFEDTGISLNIASALRDTDGSESLSIKITGMPSTALLSAGLKNPDGSWSLTGSQLANLKLTPPVDGNIDFNLTVSATSTESDGATSTVTTTLPVNLIGVADTPTVSVLNSVAAMSTQANISITGALTDTDGSEILTYVVHGVPDGFGLTSGMNNGDNTWTLTAGQLSGIKLTPPPTFQGQLNMYVTAVSHENDGDVKIGPATPFNVRIGNYSAGYLVDLGVGVDVGGIGVGVHVGALPDIDLFPATGGILTTGGFYTKEDSSKLIADAPSVLGLPILSTVVNLVSTIEYRGIPAGVTFSAGTNVGGGVWRFTAAQLNNLFMNTSANSDADFTITVVARMLAGLANVALVSTPVYVQGQADMPNLSANAANGTEDNAVALTINGALTDTDGSETLTYLVSGMPSGFSLNKGINNGNNTWSLGTSDLPGLKIVPKDNYSGTVNLTVSAIATEREGDQNVKQQNVSFTLTATADAPTVTALPVQGNEDTAIPLNLAVALTDTDGSEHISALTISGLPVGATLLNATDNHNGTWSVNPAYIPMVQLVPPVNWHGDINLSVSVTSQESSNAATATTTTGLLVHINPIADTPIATATNSTGNAGESIALHVGAALTDTDGYEHLSIVISGVPDTMMLSAGLNNGDGNWTLTNTQLINLSLATSDGFSGDVNLTVTAYSQDGNNTSLASSHQDFTVHVLPMASLMMTDSGMSYDGGSNGWLGNNDNSISNDVSNTNVLTDYAAVPPSASSDLDHAFQNYN